MKRSIARGELKPGDALPTESALQTEFGVSRVTVRQALRQLVEEQILESIQGSGTYVKEERVNYDIFQLTSFDEKLTDRHVDTHSEVLIFEVIPADDFLQQQLQITAQNRVWHVKRVRYRKQKPMALEETWMPLALFPDLTWQVMENSKYHFIEEVKKMVIDRSNIIGAAVDAPGDAPSSAAMVPCWSLTTSVPRRSTPPFSASRLIICTRCPACHKRQSSFFACG